MSINIQCQTGEEADMIQRSDSFQ